MRIALLALIIIAAVVAYWLHFSDIVSWQALIQDKDPAALKDVLFVLLAAWLLAEALFGRLKASGTVTSPTSSAKPPSEVATDKSKELKEEILRLEDLSESQKTELAALSNEKAMLRTAIEDLELRLKAAEGKAENKIRSENINAEIVNFLALLQEKGRFVDFLMDDIASYEDQQVGAAARVVHQGCASVLKSYFEVQPIFSGAEGGSVTLEEGFDTRSYRLIGRVLGKPPITGVVLHRGWQTAAITLPRVSVADQAAQRIIAPTEVELS